MNFKMQVITGQIKVITGMHIGTGNTEMHIGGTDNPVIKNGSEPYIPGSSIKGKLRSLLSLYTGSTDNKDTEIVAKLFGIGAGDKNEQDIKTIKTARLSFWDCFISENWRQKILDKQMSFTEIKMENTIDRGTGTAKNPRNTERVIPGTEFDFKLTIKVFDNENLLPAVLGSMKLLEMDSLGGSGSRGYGKIKFENLKIDGQDIQNDLDNITPFENRFI